MPNGTGIRLNGERESSTILIRAAWQIVPTGNAAQFKTPDGDWKYKVSTTKIDNETAVETIALIGLHIVIKTPKYPQWVWATFEHENNAPEKTNLPSTNGQSYTLYSSGQPQNYTPSWEQRPSPADIQLKKPVQVVREIPIDPKYSVPINDAIHSLIRQRDDKSVWQYYNLVTTQWPSNPVDLGTQIMTDSLPDGDPEPPVAVNIAMETYLQLKGKGGGSLSGKSSCIGCHTRIGIKKNAKPHCWYTDYTGIFFKGFKALNSHTNSAFCQPIQ